MQFETRTGPQFGDAAPSYPDPPVPAWYRDAKLGFFLHWGLFSLPAFGVPRAPDGADAWVHHPYAEWHANTVRIPGSPAALHHAARYGTGTSYEDLADAWNPLAFDAPAFVAELQRAGGRYLVPTTKHHDGFCLWGTATTPFNAARRGPGRDLIAELHDAARDAGLRFGTYFSGALDWHVSDFPPIRSNQQLFELRRTDADFARYAAAQLDELVDRFAPDLLWNDIDWPDSGKGTDEFGVAALLARYFARVPDGVVNDRWGVPYHGFLTREYMNVEGTQPQVWEATRGLGRSFGYNEQEGATDHLDGAALIRLLAETVAANGNLLLNIGPTASGEIPPLQLAPIRALGDWLRINGAAIYGTRPWAGADAEAAAAPGSAAVFTAADGTVNELVLDPAHGQAPVPTALRGRPAHWLAADGPLPVEITGDRLTVPPAVRDQPVVVAVYPAGDRA